ncbi:MAG: hypothetical protein ACI88A_000392 [Paraglaciecola sp.]|jgi:hypothetical protein
MFGTLLMPVLIPEYGLLTGLIATTGKKQYSLDDLKW